VTVTGYDLAVLMKPAGEARFANVRKLTRLAAEYEAAEGRDLRGLLDFLAARADADADAQAATALEGHDGVRIMTVHSAKGLEFDVVAIPHLSRPLLAQVRAPLLTVGREPEAPRVGMQLRRLGARGVDLYAQRELLEEAQRREAEEELRLFHVGATRARERLLLSGVVRPSPPSRSRTGEAAIERIVAALDIDRERDSTVPIAPPEPRPGLEAAFEANEIAVRVNLASAERAAELAAVRRELDAPRDPGTGPAPLVETRVARRPRLPLSYTAIATLEEGAPSLDLSPIGRKNEISSKARGIAVHELLEWSARNGWREPSTAGELLAPVRAWLGSGFFAERVRDAPSRAEVPLLVEVAGTVLRGSIDLLVERPDAPPLIVDYKTDRLGDSSPAERAAHYAVQRDIYAFAVSEARNAAEVEVAYVFLERPDEPAVELLDDTAIAAGRKRIEEAIERVASDEPA
jgi:ATP-dependent exoDNAse (exonuclease V) beta subunit